MPAAAAHRRRLSGSGRANAWSCDWSAYQPPKPAKPGIHVLRKVDIATLRNYIDWTPFFLSWELAGKYPRILEDEVVGEEAKRLFADAQAMLDRLERSGEVEVTGMLGLFPANRSAMTSRSTATSRAAR
jgi:5-methyltetrahydrofolate--homocysteine methyltransferase